MVVGRDNVLHPPLGVGSRRHKQTLRLFGGALWLAAVLHTGNALYNTRKYTVAVQAAHGIHRRDGARRQRALAAISADKGT
jgi:hypothetical protein